MIRLGSQDCWPGHHRQTVHSDASQCDCSHELRWCDPSRVADLDGEAAVRGGGGLVAPGGVVELEGVFDLGIGQLPCLHERARHHIKEVLRGAVGARTNR